MGCPFSVRVSAVRATFLVLTLSAAACSGGNPEAGAAGTTGAAGPFIIEVSQTYLTIENRTGVPLAGGTLEIVPRGVLPPFRTTLPRLENGSARDITLSTFRAPDGTLFNRSLARARTVRIAAKDINGKEYTQEVPFE